MQHRIHTVAMVVHYDYCCRHRRCPHFCLLFFLNAHCRFYINKWFIRFFYRKQDDTTSKRSEWSSVWQQLKDDDKFQIVHIIRMDFCPNERRLSIRKKKNDSTRITVCLWVCTLQSVQVAQVFIYNLHHNRAQRWSFILCVISIFFILFSRFLFWPFFRWLLYYFYYVVIFI